MSFRGTAKAAKPESIPPEFEIHAQWLWIPDSLALLGFWNDVWEKQ
jgi:hypothetical protein